MTKWLAGIAATVLAGVIVYYLTAGFPKIGNPGRSSAADSPAELRSNQLDPIKAAKGVAKESAEKWGNELSLDFAKRLNQIQQDYIERVQREGRDPSEDEVIQGIVESPPDYSPAQEDLERAAVQAEASGDLESASLSREKLGVVTYFAGTPEEAQKEFFHAINLSSTNESARRGHYLLARVLPATADTPAIDSTPRNSDSTPTSRDSGRTDVPTTNAQPDQELDLDYDNSTSKDTDGDGVSDRDDNCPENFNRNQNDSDGDSRGDVCDAFPDLEPADLNVEDQTNYFDADGSDPDADGDQVPDNLDNCPNVQNTAQFDSDSDGLGDACDSNPFDAADSDGDGVPDPDDNCVDDFNPNQDDSDEDGFGDVCDFL